MLLKLLAKRLASALLLIAVPFIMNAQQKTITGTVSSDKDGSPVGGVSVIAKGSKSGTQTAADGSYSISVAQSVTKLVFTSIGYASQEISIGNSGTANVVLVATAEGLSEVVVIGYGTARKKDLTGSVGSLKEKDFNKGVYTSADQLIQGKVAGVQMINNSGAPGGGSTVKIRGASALTGSGQPLYVIDGVPLDGRSPRPGLGDIGVGGSNPGNNALNFINPSDIASIDILKDASATAIYGSRAAYGVVLITTKKGTSGQPKIEFGTSIGFSKIAKRIKVLNATQFREASVIMV